MHVTLACRIVFVDEGNSLHNLLYTDEHRSAAAADADAAGDKDGGEANGGLPPAERTFRSNADGEGTEDDDGIYRSSVQRRKRVVLHCAAVFALERYYSDRPSTAVEISRAVFAIMCRQGRTSVTEGAMAQEMERGEGREMG
jgi:hypothetical protein